MQFHNAPLRPFPAKIAAFLFQLSQHLIHGRLCLTMENPRRASAASTFLQLAGGQLAR